ncbi:farnesyl pyrophosphate synthase isoform X2 [Monomorium pharaonis]|uniref:farnesyl pyrophosphate synthase isoform X2 n=1 Tax=Monomorium pharaonis TaxID=307658 RepID=UPI00063FA84D|nr:farnesyl pyrophosphate synthase isoform X2 [Monomorium pharaonis]
MSKESQEMMAVWPDFVCNVMDVVKELKILEIEDVTKWVEKVLQYNVPTGKRIRSLAFIQTYKSLVPNDQLTEENIYLVRILAWGIEVLQAAFLIIDDAMDRSQIRRGKPCWYKCNDKTFANDGVLLENITYYIIRKYLGKKECYFDFMEVFQNTIFATVIGESLQFCSINFGKKPNLDLFTIDRYNSIIKYKAAYYTYFLPVIAAMHLAGIKDPEVFRQAKTILLEIGQLFQIQDDYLDIFGDSEVYRKDGNDIQEGQCTWLIVTALQRATPEQRKILEECYGTSDLEKVKQVKQLFIDLDLPNAYFIHEKEKYNIIIAHIQQTSYGFLQKLLFYLLENMYRRKS